MDKAPLLEDNLLLQERNRLLGQRIKKLETLLANLLEAPVMGLVDTEEYVAGEAYFGRHDWRKR